MRDVHAGLIGVFCDAAVARGVAPEVLFADLPGGREALGWERRLAWDEYVAIVERMAEALGGAEQLVAVGEEAVAPQYTRMVRRVAAYFASAEQVYQVAHRWWAPGGYRNLDLRCEPLGPRQLRAEWTVPEHQGGSVAHFRLVEGALRALPSILGLPHALISAEIAPQRAVYRITPPPSLSLVARLRRAFGLVFSARTAIEELSRLEDELVKSYRELGEANRQLAEREERHRALIETARDVIVEFSEQGELLYVSSAARAFGHEPSSFLGQHPWEWVHPDDRAAAVQVFREAVEGAGGDSVVYRLRRGDGEWAWGEINANRYRTSGGEFRLVATVRDVTERRRLEEERERHSEHLEEEVARRTLELESANRNLRRLQSSLLEAERLGAGESLAGSVAHAINNPLSALMGTAEMLLAERWHPEIARMQRLARRIGDVVARTMSLYREGRIQRTPERAADLIEDVVEQVARRAEQQGVELTVKVESGLPLIAVDRALLGSALVSLAENGLDAMPGGGSLLLEAALVENLDVLELRVCDSGPGIPPDLRKRVFEPFFSTKGGGTGLGLAIVRGAVQGHGGHVRITEHAGGGAAISVQLPLQVEP